MARRRGLNFRRRTTSKSRLLEWGGISTGAVALGANVVQQTILIAASDFGFKITHFRSVGQLSMNVQSALAVNVVGLFHFGLYLARRGAADIPTTLSPQLTADIAADDWLWWGGRRVTGPITAANDPVGTEHASYVPFDVKVKRILDVGDEIRLVTQCTVAWIGSQDVRTLLRPAGI